ncbi:MAG: hypothetical protein ACYC9J_06265 [Sulfuricaulis sp.]
MNWLSRLTGTKGSSTTVNVSGKEIDVFCSFRADRALAGRALPLVVEIELAFACFARKQVHFHETPTSENVIEVNGKLALQITTIIPDTCDVTTQATDMARATVRNFLPKWVRIDCVKEKWVGEYGL